MRQLDVILSSNPFWGVVALFFLLVGGAWKGDVVTIIALSLAWGVGLFTIYGVWASQAGQDWRLLCGLALLYSGVVILLYYGIDPHRPVSRPVVAEPVGGGTFVTQVTLLDVGASPSDASIPDPPDWHEPKMGMPLRFTDSPLLTTAVRRQITRDLSAFREYLTGLEIPVAGDFPPIGVSDRPGSAQARMLGSLPTYRSSATINQGWILDRRAVTGQYVDYAIAEMLRQRAGQHSTVSVLQDMMATSAIAGYYNWSFWNYKPDNAGGHWSSQLWQIRGVLGKRFTDRLVAFTLKGLLDSPEEDADPHFDTYFYRKMQAADSVIDNNAEKMGEIKAIIEKSGIDVSTPRAHLVFSATSVKRHDGSFQVEAIATNGSNVPTGRGQLRTHFAPDVRLLRAPKGALSDPSTNLQSARLIPFESIAAHATARIYLEFIPVRGTFPPDVKFFVTQFDYQCEACGSDTHVHGLKFTLSNFE